jgi:antitoxin ParD1/3/4
MRAYKKYVVIEDSQRVVLSDLPFEAGQRVEIVMIADEPQTAARLETLHTLLTSTQALPQARTLTEADIAAEVAAVRTGR